MSDHGYVTHSFAADSNYVVTAAQQAYTGRIRFTTGSWTQGRTVTFIQPVTDKGYFERPIHNDTAYLMTVSHGAGTTVVLAPGEIAVVGFMASNAARVQTNPRLPGVLHTQAMADAPQTVSVADSYKNIFVATGVNAAVRALTISRPVTDGSLVLVRCDCTVFGITVQFLTGAATATILPGTSAIVYGDGTNAQILMNGT